jgi:hypothetical protein
MSTRSGTLVGVLLEVGLQPGACTQTAAPSAAVFILQHHLPTEGSQVVRSLIIVAVVLIVLLAG